MQSIALEMNVSETAFLVPIDGGYHLRWFTPAHEVDLCGHATLAAAHVLWTETDASFDEPLRFTTRSGELTATHADGLIQLDFPAERAEAATPPPNLLSALGVDDSPTGIRFIGPDTEHLALFGDKHAARDLATEEAAEISDEVASKETEQARKASRRGTGNKD